MLFVQFRDCFWSRNATRFRFQRVGTGTGIVGAKAAGATSKFTRGVGAGAASK
jgi:hypothetical protein